MKKIKACFLRTNSEVKSNAGIKALVNYSKALKESIKAEKELSSGSVELNQDQLQAIRNSCARETEVWKYILDLIKADRGKKKKSILEDLLK